MRTTIEPAANARPYLLPLERRAEWINDVYVYTIEGRGKGITS